MVALTEDTKVFQGQTLHPLSNALQIFTDASREAWGTQLGDLMARGIWSLPESKLHINYLGLKTVFLAVKEFQDLCSDKIVLIVTDNTIVVAYINKEGAIGPTVYHIAENSDLVLHEAGDSQGATHSRMAKCGRKQSIQTRPDHPNRVVKLKIPLCLPNMPNLLTQPFSQILHKSLPNLNLYALLLESQQSRSKASLRQWQHELRLFKEFQPDQSMRLS